MPRQILLVEDNAGDVRLMQEVFRETTVPFCFHVVSDGVEAMEFLNQEGVHANAVRPDFILLDLNLPRMDGRDVLARIKSDETLRQIPTIILTTSDADSDIERSYQLHANCYLIKPVLLDAFESMVRSINEFWLTKARLPRPRPQK